MEFTVKQIHFFDRKIWKTLCFGTLICALGNFSPCAGQMTVEEFGKRLEQMERENETLRQQIAEAQMETSAGASPVPYELPSSSVLAEAGSSDTGSATDVKEGLDPETLPSLPVLDLEKKDRLVSVVSDYDSIMLNMAQDDLEAELARYKNWQWNKDAFTFTPYVWFWLTGTHETNSLYPGDYPIWVKNEDRSHTYFDMKSTRLGLNVTAPEIASMPGVRATGVFEMDFQNTYVFENEADVELRKAYIQLQSDEFMFLMGQTWELLSPFYPTVLNWGFGAGGGNFGFRRPMVRFDRYFKQHNGRFAIQTCILSSSTSNFTDANGLAYQGKMGRYPEFQLRFERTFTKNDLWKSALFAVGAKIGDKEYVMQGDEFHRTSWAFTADTKIQFTDRFFFLGEFFTGELHAVNCAGIMQDLNTQTRENVGSTGGWFAFGWDITPDLHYSIGYSIDDPWNSTLCQGMKGKNHFIYTNISRDLTKSLNLGFEYQYFETEYVGVRTVDSHVFMICSMFKI